MTNRDEEIKAAIVIKADEIAFASPEMNRAAEHAAYQLHEFVDFVQTIDTELTRTEAIFLTAEILSNLPLLFGRNRAFIESIRENAKHIKSRRIAEQ